MKKFFIAVAASFLIFSGQPDAQAASIENIGEQDVQLQPAGRWAHFRDKYILNRETENERRDRMEWERRHGYRPDRRKHYYDDYYYPPPPPRHHPRHDRHHHRRY